MMTPPGRGAVASLLVYGELSRLDPTDGDRGNCYSAGNGKPISQQKINRIVYGHWGTATSEQEEVVCCRVALDRFELHCHGGQLAIQRIQQDLIARGFEVVPWQQLPEFSEWEREYQQAIVQTMTTRTAFYLLDQQTHYRELIRQLIDQLEKECNSNDFAAITATLQDILKWKQFGLHLTKPRQVVLFGRPNVGKSSLINAILGYQRAIVHDQPGTTRDLVTATTALDGWPIDLIDTAGLRNLTAQGTTAATLSPDQQIESAGMVLAKQQLADADLKLLLIDLSEEITKLDEELLQQHPEALLIANKVDLSSNVQGQKIPDALRVSAKTGAGIPGLCATIVNRLIPDVPAPKTVIPFTARQCSLIEQVLVELTQSLTMPSVETAHIQVLLEELIS